MAIDATKTLEPLPSASRGIYSDTSKSGAVKESDKKEMV